MNEIKNNDMWYRHRFLSSVLPLNTLYSSPAASGNVSSVDEDIFVQYGKKVLGLGFVAKSVPIFAEILSDNKSCLCDTEHIEFIFADFNAKTISMFWEILFHGHCISNRDDKLLLNGLLSSLGLEYNFSVETVTTDSMESGSEASEDELLCDTDNFVGQCFDLEEDNIAIVGDNSPHSFQYCDDESNTSAGESSAQFMWESSKTVSQCSRYCDNGCDKIFEQWSDKEQNALKVMFRSEDGKIQVLKNNLLSHLWSQERIGVPTQQYTIYNQAFCTKFLSHYIGVSEYILKQVIHAFWSGRKMFRHGNTGGIKQPTVATTNFICWLKIFAESYGQFAPDTNTVVLNYWANKSYLFNLYLSEAPSPHLSKSAFYQNFDKFFAYNRVDKSLPHIIISKYSSHSVCNQCVAINYYITQCKTEAQLRIATDLKNQHKMVFGDARRKVQEIRQTAIQFPSENLFIQVNSLVCYQLNKLN